MTELEQIKQENEKLKQLLIQNGIIKKDKAKAFSDVDMSYLDSLGIIKEVFGQKDKFDFWFKNDLEIEDNKLKFLEELLDRYTEVLSSFNEDKLKVVFIGQILEQVNFFNKDLDIGNFYHTPLSFKNDKINFNGFCDFYVAKGLKNPKAPYFFIQEYKQSKKADDPEPQLLAELITAVELNNWDSIKGAYIVGAIWNFVILEKIGKDKYQYFVSINFDSSKIEDLKIIYRNLLFVKNEIIEFIQKDNNI